jgi:hypothetical protein
MSFENLAITTDSKVVYSDINTYNLVSTRSRSVDISRECNVQKQSPFSVKNHISSLIFPVKILPVIFRNVKRNVLDSRKINLVEMERGVPSIKSDWNRFEDNFLFAGFVSFKSFCNRVYSKLRFKIKSLPNIFIDKMMQVKLMTAFIFKSNIRSVLTSLKIRAKHIKQFFSFGNFDFYCGDKHHKLNVALLIFKGFGNEEEKAFLPCLKAGVSCPKFL